LVIIPVIVAGRPGRSRCRRRRSCRPGRSRRPRGPFGGAPRRRAVRLVGDAIDCWMLMSRPTRWRPDFIPRPPWARHAPPSSSDIAGPSRPR